MSSEFRLAPLAPYPWEGDPIALWDFARRATPRWYHVWFLAGDCLDCAREGERRSRELQEWAEMRRWCTRALQIEWRRLRVFQDKIAPQILKALADHSIEAVAAGDHGDVLIPRRLATLLVIDLIPSTLSLSDGSMTWRGVTLRWTAANLQPAPSRVPDTKTSQRKGGRAAIDDEQRLAAVRNALTGDQEGTPVVATSPRTKGRAPKLRESVKQYVSVKYPQGLPANVTLEALKSELAAGGINAGVRTISRALGRR